MPPPKIFNPDFSVSLRVRVPVFHEGLAAAEPAAYYANSFRFNYRRFFVVDAREKLSIILQSEEHIPGLSDGKERFIREVGLLSQSQTDGSRSPNTE